MTTHAAHGKSERNTASNETKKGFIRVSGGSAHTV
jgi:hypothetical protein